jgi:uncharacterized protein YaiL (DUF2058 family)
MSDLRDQLRKAGLVSEKQLRQAKHKDRVHASQVGHEGLIEERRRSDDRQRSEKKARKEADRQRERERQKREGEAAAAHRLEQVVQSGWIREATIGSRRFFFVTRNGRISCLDLSEPASRRLLSGTAAIVEATEAIPGDYCVVVDRAAREIAELRRELIRFWNRGQTTANDS